ncbi:hypothetical protein CLOACE_13590 [Clostridium acetireducens DSM 10703]|uniref:Flagellin N-methylase n=1 Tax=Clostridium acetireducens DSM 10703 TaxID=1121290 RepID=A0A1E8EZ43_9CLOT|nr:zinc/iron-chelating domain-containing protein [Clostridium acetireducens]OFI05978.1 hypothetical protein CLOACE_13590 [Clostridium acetireducens DSM 10703]
MFNCDMCGCCCRSVSTNDIYKHLDRGDGTCKYFENETNKCSIYENRPIFCCIDKCYEKYFKNVMSIKQYYNLNYEACKKLKEYFNNK